MSWGFAWDASRAGGLHGSLQTKKEVLKTALKCHLGGSKIAPKSLQNGSRRLPGAPPKSGNESGNLFCSFLWPLGRLLGCSWGAFKQESLHTAPGGWPPRASTVGWLVAGFRPPPHAGIPTYGSRRLASQGFNGWSVGRLPPPGLPAPSVGLPITHIQIVF